MIDRLVSMYNRYRLDRKCIRIANEINKMKNDSNIKIMFGMSFSIWDATQLHDFVLSQALSLRGAEIYPVICGGVQIGECGNFGGRWDVKDRCVSCIKADKKSWVKWQNKKMYSLNDYISHTDRINVHNEMEKYDINDYKNWSIDGINIGQMAINVLVNNEMVGDEKIIHNYKIKLKNYLYNILILYHAWNKIIKIINPDIIISNDSFYYQWNLLEKIAKKRDVPFYSLWAGGRKKTWSYAFNDAVMNLDFSETWNVCKSMTLNPFEQCKIEMYIAERYTGKTMLINTAAVLNPISIPEQIKNGKNVLLATNVIWDLAALNKEIQFLDMIDWVMECIKYFEEKDDWNLIIKVHPGEEIDFLPHTIQKIGDEIRKRKPDFKPNIMILEPKTPMSLYNLIPFIKIGLVYTTTVGLELVTQGIPVLTAGKSLYYKKGFTYDTNNKKEYFDTLEYLMQNGEEKNRKKINMCLAKKFFYWYHFRFFSQINLVDASFSGASKLLIQCGADLKVGKNNVLDYVCDSILTRQPIFSDKRWIPSRMLIEENIYNFNEEDIVLAKSLIKKGYQEYTDNDINIKHINRFDLVEINNEIYYVPSFAFKNGELLYLYNEVNACYNVNPHAYEMPFLKIEKDDVVFDLGACEGFFIRYALKKGASKVFAFEPTNELIESLEKTYYNEISLNQVDIINKAVSDIDGKCQLKKDVDYICSYSVENNDDGEIEAITIDSFCKEQNIKKIDFIKMDVEGAELDVLVGMKKIMKNNQPKLAIAVYHEYENANKVAEIILKNNPEYTICFSGCYMESKPYRPYMVYAF